MVRKGCGVSLYQVQRCLSDRIRVLEHFALAYEPIHPWVDGVGVVLFARPEA